VLVDGEAIGKIAHGFVVLLAVADSDTAEDAEYLAQKVVDLRVFEDDAGKMNRSIAEVGGAVLAISQFTLLGDCRKGRRPSFTDAAPPELARPLFDNFVAAARARGIPVETGQFAAHMMVELVNDGPVTLLLDSKRVF
jgi:D-tyrosyl-tRNA(Tyr) deacylase